MERVSTDAVQNYTCNDRYDSEMHGRFRKRHGLISEMHGLVPETHSLIPESARSDFGIGTV